MVIAERDFEGLLNNVVAVGVLDKVCKLFGVADFVYKFRARLRIAPLEADFNYVRGILLHAELIKLVFEGSENCLVDFVGPVGDHLRDRIVAERVANKVQDLLVNAAH